MLPRGAARTSGGSRQRKTEPRARSGAQVSGSRPDGLEARSKSEAPRRPAHSGRGRSVPRPRCQHPVTAAPPSRARPQFAGIRPTSPARRGRSVPLSSYLAGGGGGDIGAAPHVPVPQFPIRHAAVCPHRASAAAACGPRPHRLSSTTGKEASVRSSGSSTPTPLRTTPHPPPRNRKWFQRRRFLDWQSQGGGAHPQRTRLAQSPEAEGDPGRGLAGRGGPESRWPIRVSGRREMAAV